KLDKIRNSSNSIINKFIASVRERSVLKALLLGDKSELSEETKVQYSKAGAMHVLAVSGLHVGVTYLMLTFLLGYIPYLKNSKVIKGVLVISFLWFYAFFTGMSPSVVRAVSMFSLFAFAELINRKSSILNTVFFTAFVMLLFDPLLLFQVGFQLSFMAVLGIVIFNPIFAKFFTFNSKVLNYCWKIVSVSLAAQVTTLPIVLFYFHQFPVLFLITNLIILPVMPLIMVGGTILLFFGNTFLAVLTGKVLGWLLCFINETIKIISSFEFSVIDNIHFDLDKVIIFYLLLVLLSLWLWKRKFLYFKYLTMLILACSIYSGYQLYLKKKQKWVLFSSSGSVKMGVFELYNSFILDTDTLSDNSIALWKDSEMFFGTNRRRYIDSRKIGKSSFICFYNGNLFGVITEDIDIPATLDLKLNFIIVKDDSFINKWKEYSEVFIVTNHSPQGLNKKPPDNISVYYQGASWLLLNNIISNN
ncbi:MAG: ComEC/Rec2 family competence protein, partial [Cyclobacteriaceae bacterium]|nr:ComEC/Rec2 family competence protein [Cyclobacteriaceae bacterium]